MEKFLPYMTNDFSVGLYSEETDDIYHSAHGAVNEAYEKFIKPLNLKKILSQKDEIKVLDICYGIGYNTKVLLNEFIRFRNKKITIDCVDTNSFLIKVSPFISSHINLFNRIFKKKELYKNINSYDEAKKIIELDNKNIKFNYSISKDVNFIILNQLYNDKNFQIGHDVKNLLSETQNSLFFDKGMLELVEFLSKKEDELYPKDILKAYLHNIYFWSVTKLYTGVRCVVNLFMRLGLKLNMIKDLKGLKKERL